MDKIIKKFIVIMLDGTTNDMINILRENTNDIDNEKYKMIDLIIIINKKDINIENNKLRIIFNWFLEKNHSEDISKIINDIFDISIKKSLDDIIKNICTNYFDFLNIDYNRLSKIIFEGRLEIGEYVIVKYYKEKDKKILNNLKYFLSLINNIKQHTDLYLDYNDDKDRQIEIILENYYKIKDWLKQLINKLEIYLM